MKSASLGLVALALLICSDACSDAVKPPLAPGASMADSADEVFSGVRATLANAGVQHGYLVADSAFFFDSTSRFVLRKVKVQFTKNDGTANGTITADRGEYRLRTQVLDGWGNVVATTIDGKVLRTPQLRYTGLSNLIAGDSSFVLTMPDRVQTGIGFDTDPNFNHFNVHKSAKTSGTVTAIPNR